MSALFARHALLPQGWQRDVLLAWDQRGDLIEVSCGAAPAPGVELADYVLPGLVNLHSHAFQRALGGLTETAGPGRDSFWTWRELMYRFARHITPVQLEAIAAQLFVECLRYGYTGVCEFHYLHRDPSGVFYPRPAEMAERVIVAARLSGIGITLLPSMYSYAGFGAAPLRPEQGRFQTDVSQILTIIDALEPQRDAQTEIGFAPHSLRAVTTAQIEQALAHLPARRPVHIHVAEQIPEVQQCLAFCGQRPVQYLMQQLALDEHWCLVHATHLQGHEIRAVARSGAVIGLCPSTEGSLGDGIFPLAPWIRAGGRFGIGGDSHVSHSPVEELRWLEYGQRMQQQRRNVAATSAERHVGDFLWQSAAQGGAQAAGRAVGALVPGRRADLIVLDSDHPNLHGATADEVLGRFIFCGNDNLVRDVLVGGRWVVRDGHHVAQHGIAERYKRTLAELRKL